jgi:hypothetical protein
MMKLFVPFFDIDEINSKPNGRQKIAERLQQCPAIGRLSIPSQLPKREAEKENYRSGDQNPMSGNQSHENY